MRPAASWRLQFVDERELVAPPRAVEQRDPRQEVPPQAVVDHRVQRRDARAARDKQQPRLIG